MFESTRRARELAAENADLRMKLGLRELDVGELDRELRRLQRRVTLLELKLKFQKQVATVYRRKWELAAQPPAPSVTPEAREQRAGEDRITAAINARTPAGDLETAKHLRSYADRRVAEQLSDGKGRVDYEAIAAEILEGEEDD